MRGARPGEYHDKDLVVCIATASDYYGHVGVVERRPGCETDLLHVGAVVVCTRPSDLRRVRPGDIINLP